jgi:hypothetical protein
MPSLVRYMVTSAHRVGVEVGADGPPSAPPSWAAAAAPPAGAASLQHVRLPVPEGVPKGRPYTWQEKAAAAVRLRRVCAIVTRSCIFTRSTGKWVVVSWGTQYCHMGLGVRVLRRGSPCPYLSVDSYN